MVTMPGKPWRICAEKSGPTPSAYLHQGGPEGNDVKQFRAIINYEQPVL
jgi:hypothetical protein